jgi:hypothetical protein
MLWSTSATQRHSDKGSSWRGTHPLPRSTVLVINLGTSSSFALHSRRTTRTLQGGSGHRRTRCRCILPHCSVPASTTTLLAASAGIAILASPPSHNAGAAPPTAISLLPPSDGGQSSAAPNLCACHGLSPVHATSRAIPPTMFVFSPVLGYRCLVPTRQPWASNGSERPVEPPFYVPTRDKSRLGLEHARCSLIRPRLNFTTYLLRAKGCPYERVRPANIPQLLVSANGTYTRRVMALRHNRKGPDRPKPAADHWLGDTHQTHDQMQYYENPCPTN